MGLFATMVCACSAAILDDDIIYVSFNFYDDIVCF